MPIASYIAYPNEKEKEKLLSDLAAHPCCEIIPAKNADIFILVTDTSDMDEEKTLQRYLESHTGLLCLALIQGDLENQPHVAEEA